MRTGLAQTAALLSVLALCVWLWSAGEKEPESRGTAAAADRPSLGRTGGSSVPCAAPLAWRIARVDARFGIAADEVRSSVELAAALWEGSVGRRLFVHDSAAGFPIRLTYDDRQEAGRERRVAEREVEDAWSGVLARRAELEALQARRLDAQALYEREAVDYSARVASHNDSVRAWNDRADAPATTVAALLTTEQTLRARREELAGRRAALDSLGLEVAAARDDLDRQEEEHRELARSTQERFATVAGEAALYLEMGTGTTVERQISVYRFDDLLDLRRILAHELGHALGLDHADEEGAVMGARFRLGDHSEPLAARPADVELLRARCPQWFDSSTAWPR